MELAVELSHVGKTTAKDRVLVEDVNSRGLRVVTKSMCLPGLGCVSASPARPSTNGRVVYCQRLASKSVAVGLELSAKGKQADE